jgi:hypothetical protein
LITSCQVDQDEVIIPQKNLDNIISQRTSINEVTELKDTLTKYI